MGSAAPWSRRTTRVAPRSCRPEFSYVRSLPACRSLALDRHSHSSAQLLSRTRGPKRSLDEPASDHDITGAAGVDVPRFGAAGSRRDARGLRCSAFFAYLYAGGSWGARCMYGPRAPHPMTCPCLSWFTNSSTGVRTLFESTSMGCAVGAAGRGAGRASFHRRT